MNVVRVGVGVLLRHANSILMGKRKNAHGALTWAPPGGHLEMGESIIECARREAQEEVGVTIHEPRIIGFTEDIFDANKHYVTFFVEATQFDGTITLCEPHKCYGWEWFACDNLPDDLFLTVKHFLQKYPYQSQVMQQASGNSQFRL